MLCALQTITPPEQEPVSLELAKQHLRIDTTEGDETLAFYIASAREYVEGM